YDLNKMHIGALGTLGVIVEVTLKVHPLPRAEASVVAAFDALEPAVAAAGRVFRSVLYPRAVDVVRAPSLGPDVPPGAWRVLGGPPGPRARGERRGRAAPAGGAGAAAGAPPRLDGPAHRELWRTVTALGRGHPAGAALVKLTALPTRLPALVGAAGAEAR